MNRFTQIDSLRGLLLILMTIDHLLLWPFNSWNTFYHYIYGPFGFFTAAECFFFISGILAGNLVKNKPNYIQTSLKSRLLKLYLANIIGLSVLALSAFLFPQYFTQWGDGFLNDYLLTNPLKAIFFAAIFIYLPAFFNILPLYFYFFASIPLLSKSIKSIKNIIITILCSFLLWIVGQFALQDRIQEYVRYFFPQADIGWFDIFSWQILFVLSFIAGYYQEHIKLILLSSNNIILFFISIFCIFCFLVKHELIKLNINIFYLTDIKTLGPIRLLNFLCAAYIISLIFNKFSFFNINLLAKLGNNSLSIFTYHSCLVYYLGAFTKQIQSLNLVKKIIIFICAVLSLYLVLVIKKLAKISPVYIKKVIFS